MGIYRWSDLDVKTLCNTADCCLFRHVLSNPAHVLRPYMPPQRTSAYALRKRSHNYVLPRKDGRNFLNRMLFHDIYWQYITICLTLFIFLWCLLWVRCVLTAYIYWCIKRISYYYYYDRIIRNCTLPSRFHKGRSEKDRSLNDRSK